MIELDCGYDPFQGQMESYWETHRRSISYILIGILSAQ